MNNIFLIGMPACGKSTVGVVLAKAMGKDYLDTDLTIQLRAGKTLQEIIDTQGLEAFAKIEEEVLMDVDVTNTVVATGGSAVYYPAALDRMRKTGTVLYIHTPLKDILERLNNIKSRGVTLAPGQTLENLYEERSPLYAARCDIELDAAGLSVEGTVDAIIETLRAHGRF
ncbi:MAG: shikimate kinase [Eubacterium sp.]|nr:shikimate kinase [Eubacterium sp.]